MLRRREWRELGRALALTVLCCLGPPDTTNFRLEQNDSQFLGKMLHLFRIFTPRHTALHLQWAEYNSSIGSLERVVGSTSQSLSGTFSNSSRDKSQAHKTLIASTWAKTCLVFFAKILVCISTQREERDSSASSGGIVKLSPGCRPVAASLCPAALQVCSFLLTASRTLALRTADRRCC